MHLLRIATNFDSNKGIFDHILFMPILGKQNNVFMDSISAVFCLESICHILY